MAALSGRRLGDDMLTKTVGPPRTPEEFDKHVEKYLSMILHHEEVQQIAETAKKVFRERLEASPEPPREK